MKIFKIQKFLSIIPYFSTYSILFISMFLLKRFRATKGCWLLFYGICIAVVTCVGGVFYTLSETNLLLAHIICILLCTAANFALIYLQEKTYRIFQQKTHESIQEKYNENIPTKNIFAVIGISLGGIVVILLVLLIVLKSYDPIEDINGADTSLAVFTQDEVLAGGNGWDARFVSEGLYGDHTNVAGKTKAEKYDYDKCVYECGTGSGVKTMQITNIESDTLTLTIESALESGNMEIYILIDGSLYSTVPVGQVYETTMEDIAGKEVEVRFAAEGAKLSMTVIRDYEGATHNYSENHAWD